MFGPVGYRIAHISTAARAAHDAWASYYGLVHHGRCPGHPRS